MKPATKHSSLTGVLGVALATTLAAACSGSTLQSSPSPDSDGGPGVPGEDGGITNPDDPKNQPPHSLGTILLGEVRASGQSSSSPIVSASFAPDAKKAAAAACKETLEGCEIAAAPKCKETSGFNGCSEDKACTWSATCQPTCTIIPFCETECRPDETCVASGTSGDGACKKRESFDAGPLAFSGTTTPITLYPPYAYESEGKGAPFLAGTELRVQGQGATGAGFEAFDEKFKATTFLQTTPPLKDLLRTDVFGTGPLTVAWAAGSDAIAITVAGSGGSATCKVADAAGKFAVPRAVINRVLGAGDPEGSGTLSLSVARQRTETRKDKKAKGPLTAIEVQPVGWLDLVTSSMETASFQGCSGGLSACGATGCVDTQTDKNNCGGCGKACANQCVAGKCGTTPTCDPGPENTLARCSDGCSNDGDAYIDCNDFDCCPVRKDCPVTTSCGKPPPPPPPPP